MVEAGIVRRVACAKYLLTQGINTLSSGGPFCAGLATLSFQDAAEMLLGAVGEHAHAQIKERSDFVQIIDAIDATGKGKLTHRTALIQLNRARVNFKHQGLEPRNEDAWKFRADLDAFFPITVSTFLGIDYENISLTDLVRHTRTRNWIRDAERYLNSEKYMDCVFNSAVAMSIAIRRKSRNPYRESIQKSVSFDPGDVAVDAYRTLHETAKAIDEEFHDIDRDLYLIGSGVKIADFQRFRDLTPRILFTGDQRPHGNFSHGSDFSDEQAKFCLTFVTDTVLKIQNQYSTIDKWTRPRVLRKLRSIRDTHVIVYPTTKTDPEILMELVAGSTVAECTTIRGNATGFKAILFQDEVAYVRSEDVEEVEDANDSFVEE